MRAVAILLAVLLLPGCVYHSGPYGHRSGLALSSRGYVAPAWQAPPRWHHHPHHGWYRPAPRHWHGPPPWHGHRHPSHRFRHPNHWR